MPDWLMTRVTVVLLAIFGPVYFFILILFLNLQLDPFVDPFLNLLFNYIAVPAVFSVPWVGIIYFQRYKFANTVQMTSATTSAVPLRWRVFYGTNAMFVLVFFVLPITTPFLAIVGGLYVAVYLFYTVGVGKLGGGKVAGVLAVLVAIALLILPWFVMIEFLPQYLVIWETIVASWNDFWIVVVYGVAQCLVNSLSFGAPVYFIFFAASEYDRGVYETVYTNPPTRWIRAGELIIFLIFISLYLPPLQTPFFTIGFLDMSYLFTSYINWISMGIVVIMILVKKGLKVEDNSTMGGKSNIFIVGLFLAVELFFKTKLMETLIIWLAFLLFAAVTSANYVRASSREIY